MGYTEPRKQTGSLSPTEQAVTFARRVLHYWVIALFEILNLCLRTYFRGSNKLDSTKHVEALVGNKGEVRRAGTTGAVGTCIPVNKWQTNLEILIISVARFQQIKQILKSREVFHKVPYGLLNIFIPVTVEGFSWPWSCRKPAGTCGFLPTISTKWFFSKSPLLESIIQLQYEFYYIPTCILRYSSSVANM